MARKSAVLTPEGKKAALEQLKNTAKDAGVNLKNAKETVKALESVKASSTRQYTAFQKLQDKAIVKATKELARTETKHAIATAAVTELKNTVVAPVAKPARTAPSTPQSAVQSTQSTVTQ